LLAGRTGIPAVRVAAHWDAAGADPEACAQAATWWQRAAEESARLRAYEDAAALQAKAVLASDAAGATATQLAETSLAAARAWYRAGRYADAVSAADRAAGHAGSAGRPDLVADAALAVGWVSYPAAQEVITRLARVALDQGGAAISDATRARLLAQQVAMLGNYAEAHGGPQTAEAMALARRSGDPAALLEAIGARMASIPEIGSAAEQRALAEEAVEISSRLREPVPELLAHTWLLRAAVELGVMDLATEELLRLRLIADATRLPLAEWHALRASVAMAILRGDFAEIPERHERANAVARESGDIVAANVGNAAVFEVAQRRGVPIPEPEATLRMLDLAPMSTLIEAPKALLLHQIGRTDEARVIYERLVPLLGGHPEYRPWWPVMYILLDLAERFRDVDAGARLAVEQEPYSRGVVGGLGTSTVWFIGNPNRHLGRALALAGRLDEAMEAFETALVCDERMGARPDVALGRLEIAALLARSAGDRESRTTRLRSALEQVRRAAEETRTLDMPGHAARADAMAAELAQALAQEDPLSPREREVVDLVVEGLTNQQIAGRLFLSERTVESHVRAALMKLGCRNRAELIRRETGGGSRGT
jgi:DNA-binding CsgD family transcriptional regulator